MFLTQSPVHQELWSEHVGLYSLCEHAYLFAWAQHFSIGFNSERNFGKNKQAWHFLLKKKVLFLVAHHESWSVLLSPCSYHPFSFHQHRPPFLSECSSTLWGPIRKKHTLKLSFPVGIVHGLPTFRFHAHLRLMHLQRMFHGSYCTLHSLDTWCLQ